MFSLTQVIEVGVLSYTFGMVMMGVLVQLTRPKVENDCERSDSEPLTLRSSYHPPTASMRPMTSMRPTNSVRPALSRRPKAE